ncbi:hypothetical protein EYF80_044101 [Liparis tanakae]|uniref:Secreted protein n=1 Tax=Liparis tanakae TaxID=230148 RepID=A0A4Z2FXV1_9TELE|nr:hypothetical protein EYF80_044101 [Liparis tanakae]
MERAIHIALLDLLNATAAVCLAVTRRNSCIVMAGFQLRSHAEQSSRPEAITLLASKRENARGPRKPSAPTRASKDADMQDANGKTPRGNAISFFTRRSKRANRLPEIDPLPSLRVVFMKLVTATTK